MGHSQRKVLISGGARGIGRCLVRRFLEKGDKVYVLDIDEQELKHTTDNHLKKYKDSGVLEASICNLRDVEDIRKNVDQAAKFLGGKIDILINNGGIASPKWKDGKTMADKETFQEWQAYIETNLTAPFAVSQACIPYMKADNDVGDAEHVTSPLPCIIHVGSFRSHQSDPNQEGYASSKAGQLGLLHSMAISLQGFGIRVNSVSPGRIKVSHESKEGDENGIDWAGQNEEKDADDHPTNRAGMPEDIFDAIDYLANAGFVNGHEIVVDGGAMIKKS